jgi:hypothetical protein
LQRDPNLNLNSPTNKIEQPVDINSKLYENKQFSKDYLTLLKQETKRK